MTKYPTPHKAGFYWAKWKIAEEGTLEGDLLTLSDEWEVVNVYENSIDDTHPDHLRVQVPGVEKSQSLDNFFWGPCVPLPPKLER